MPNNSSSVTTLNNKNLSPCYLTYSTGSGIGIVSNTSNTIYLNNLKSISINDNSIVSFKNVFVNIDEGLSYFNKKYHNIKKPNFNFDKIYLKKQIDLSINDLFSLFSKHEYETSIDAIIFSDRMINFITCLYNYLYLTQDLECCKKKINYFVMVASSFETIINFNFIFSIFILLEVLNLFDNEYTEEKVKYLSEKVKHDHLNNTINSFCNYIFFSNFKFDDSIVENYLNKKYKNKWLNEQQPSFDIADIHNFSLSFFTKIINFAIRKNIKIYTNSKIYLFSELYNKYERPTEQEYVDFIEATEKYYEINKNENNILKDIFYLFLFSDNNFLFVSDDFLKKYFYIIKEKNNLKDYPLFLKRLYNINTENNEKFLLELSLLNLTDEENLFTSYDKSELL